MMVDISVVTFHAALRFEVEIHDGGHFNRDFSCRIEIWSGNFLVVDTSVVIFHVASRLGAETRARDLNLIDSE